MMKKIMTPSVSPSRGGLLSRRFQQIAKCAGAIILGSVALLGASSLSSCSDELDFRVNNGATPGTLTICIPNVEGAAEYGATRSDEYRNTRAGETEGDINSLWICAYPTDASTQGNPIYKQIVTSSTTHNVSDLESDYKTYTVEGFKAGKYHIYLLANLEDYIGNTSLNNIRKDDLEELVLNFSPEKFPTIGNLPMACLDNQVSSSPNGSGNSNGEFEIKATGANTLYADMRFLVAKVRYTILFDRSGGSGTNVNFSNQFSSNNVDFSTSGVASSIVPQTALINATTSGTNFEKSITLAPASYPSGATAGYLTIESQNSAPGDLGPGSWTTDDSQKAWQGVVYLPENNVKASATKLTFSPVDGTEIKSDNCHFDLFVDGNGPLSDGIERGHMYDVVAKLITPDVEQLEVTASVHDWNTLTLSYTLHGPYNLEVEATNLEFDFDNSSNITFWYKSDVTVRLISPKYNLNGKEIDFYTYSRGIDNEKRTTFTIGVSPNIPVSTLEEINNDEREKAKYQYIELKAGNLVKKITINPLKMGPFLDVTPNEITIDKRDFISAGAYSGFVDVVFRTNLDGLKVKLIPETDDYEFNFGTNKEPDYLSEPKGLEKFPYKSNGYIQLLEGTLDEEGNTDENSLSVNKVTSSSQQNFALTPKEGVLRVDFSNLNSSDDLWQNNHEYILIFEVTYGEETFKKYVKIHITKNNTDYIIHFKATKGVWERPHIYIYQALELPSSNKNYKGYTVGYTESSNENAALEYEFGYGISFKGWKGYGGTIDPNAAGSVNTSNGFFYFSSGDFNPKSNNFNNPNYNYTTAFNQAHFDNINGHYVCPWCYRDNRAETLWPGVGMKYEGSATSEVVKDNGSAEQTRIQYTNGDSGNGWWTYILSGVATPGRALIMFAGHHNNDQIKNYSAWRYPEDKQPGIPLFDFPDKEGWFVYDGSDNMQFVDDEPKDARVRIYWPSSMGPGLYVWGPKEPHKWDNSKNIKKTDSRYSAYNYMEFDYEESSKTLYYKYSNIYENGTQCSVNHNGGTLPSAGNSNSSFQYDAANKLYVAYLKADEHSDASTDNSKLIAGYPGTPSSGGETTNSYRIYWPECYGSGLYLWGWTFSSGKVGTWVDNSDRSDRKENGFYYSDFTVINTSSPLKYKFSNPPCGSGDNHDHEGGTTSNFENINGIMTGYISSEYEPIQKNVPEKRTYVDMYITGDATEKSDWNVFGAYRFYEITSGSQWRTGVIKLTNGKYFKIRSSDNNWSTSIGNPANNEGKEDHWWIDNNKEYEGLINNSGSYNLYKNGDFTGYVLLTKNTDGKYKIKLIPVSI